MRYLKILLISLLIWNLSFSASKVKIKTEVNVVGVRNNFLVGYGIVVGLNGTGDGVTSRYTLLSIANMLRKMGVYIDDPNQVRTRNAAAVIVTASLPPFAKNGMRFDVHVSSLGDTKDIANGVLIRTPLRGPDGKVYAFAQGPVSTGGGITESNKGGKIQKNFPTSGIVVNGGIVERDLPFSFDKLNTLTLTLKKPDLNIADKIENAINNHFNKNIAKAIDPSTVKVDIPSNEDKVKFLSKVLNLEIELENEPVIVIDERTGTVIMSGDIVLETPIYVSHGNIYVEVVKKPIISQPPPLSGGTTQQETQTLTRIVEENGRIFGIEKPTLKDLVEALNEIGVSPRDLIAIIQAIKNAGKIHAKIEVM